MTSPATPPVFVQQNASVPAADGVSFVSLVAGDAWHADDPIVVAHPDLFGPIPPIVRASPGHEPAESTELRVTRRPRR